MKRIRLALSRLAAAAVLLPAAAAAGASDAAPAFEEAPCPAALADLARCHSARDAHGAWLLAAIPHRWDRTLVVHAHGGPRLGPPQRGDSAEDLERFAAMVRAGRAWIGSSYRRGGYGVRMAAADVEESRRAFQARWGRPARTLLHGQSWGGNVAAKAAELYALDIDGRPNYDGVLLTNGVLSGGSRAYGFRADLRAVYQFYCRNHPAPGEARYPLWQGLPADARMSREELRRRVDACTGVDTPAARRSPDQAARLRDILAVTGIREGQLVAHLAWGTFHFRDLVQRRLGGGNPFDNTATVYRGAADDEALNAGVERFAADPDAVAKLAYDADLSGLIVLPTVSLHALHDPVVPAAAQAAYADTVRAAGRERLLLAARTDEDQHSRLAEDSYMAALDVLERWLESGARPPADAFQAACLRRAGDPSRCRYLPPARP